MDARPADGPSMAGGAAAVDRLMARLPEAVRGSFTAEQIAALAAASASPADHHILKFQVSVPWYRRRYYVSFFMGREQRSIGRLQREGQVAGLRIAILYAVVL